MERKLCGMLIRAVAFWAAFSVRAGEPELSGYSGFCDGDIVKDAVVDFSGLSLRGDAGLYYNAGDSLTHETLRGAAGIRRDFVTDPSGLRLTKMEAHGRYLRVDEPVPVTCARDFPVKGDGRRFVSETFDFEGTATVSMTVHPRLIMAPGDTIYNVAERRVMITGVRVSADSLSTPLSFSTSYFYSDGNRMPVAVVDCTDAPPSSGTGGNAVAYLFPAQEGSAAAQNDKKNINKRSEMMGQRVSGQVEILVCDTMGRIIYHATGDESGNYAMPDLTPGHYVLTTIYADDTAESKTVYVGG